MCDPSSQYVYHAPQLMENRIETHIRSLIISIFTIHLQELCTPSYHKHSPVYKWYIIIASLGLLSVFVGVNSSQLNFFFGFDLCGDDLPAGCPLDQSFIRFRFKMLVLYTKNKKKKMHLSLISTTTTNTTHKAHIILTILYLAQLRISNNRIIYVFIYMGAFFLFLHFPAS